MHKRNLLIPVLAMTTLLLAAGCGSDSDSADSSSTSGTTQHSTASSSVSGAPASSSSASQSAEAPSSSPSADTEDVDPNHCLSSNLAVALADDAGGGAAGSHFYQLTFTNTGGAACTLDGHPGVSFVGGDDGHQIGASAAMDTSTPNTAVTVQPGGSAYAVLKVSNAGNYDGDQCQAETARGLRIYPPDETKSMFLEQSFDACASDSVDLLTIGPVQTP